MTVAVKTISDDAVNFLRKVRDVGLTVHWYHLRDSYEWGDDSHFDHNDFNILKKELYRTYEKHESIGYAPEITVERVRIENGIYYHEHLYLYSEDGNFRTVIIEGDDVINVTDEPKNAIFIDRDGHLIGWNMKEKVTSSIGSTQYAGGPLVPVIHARQNFRPVTYTVHESDWLDEKETYSSYEYGIERQIFVKPEKLGELE